MDYIEDYYNITDNELLTDDTDYDLVYLEDEDYPHELELVQ